MALIKSKTPKKDPWEGIFSDYGVKNPYAIRREIVPSKLATEHPIVTIGGKGSKSIFGPIAETPKQTGFYDSEDNFIPLSEKQLADLGDKKTFTTYQPSETQVFIDATTGKEIKAPTKLQSLGREGLSYELKKEGDISYRVKFDESGNPSFYAKQLEDDSFGSFLTEGLLAISPILLAGFPLGSVLGSALAPTLSAAAQAAIGNALVQGTLAEIQGGDFLKGAAGGAIGSGVGNFVTPGISEALGGGTFGNVAAGALTGGGVSALMGGDFATGALKGGVGAGISDYQQQLRQEQFDTAMTESGLAGQTSIDEFVAPQVDLTAPSVQDVINQISAPADQVDDGVQEIVITAPREQTVPTQADMQSSIDALLLELDPYKVTSENININNLVNELVDGVPAEPDVQPEAVDNSKLISALNILKVLSPVAITALLAKNKTSSGTDEQTGYPILPIPGDWKSPTYNQAFTPSAPIDFGTSALLAGTQWENPQQTQAPQPYNLSNLINTLNYQPVPFVPQQYDMPQQVSTADFMSQFQAPTVGTDELIGNLGGKPVSIADIISGIQSQYG